MHKVGFIYHLCGAAAVHADRIRDAERPQEVCDPVFLHGAVQRDKQILFVRPLGEDGNCTAESVIVDVSAVAVGNILLLPVRKIGEGSGYRKIRIHRITGPPLPCGVPGPFAVLPAVILQFQFTAGNIGGRKSVSVGRNAFVMVPVDPLIVTAHRADGSSVLFPFVDEVTGIDTAGIPISRRNRIPVLEFIYIARNFTEVYLQEGMFRRIDAQDIINDTVIDALFMRHILRQAVGIDIDGRRNLPPQDMNTGVFIP